MSAPVVNYAVDITTTIQQKLDAIGAHASQVSGHFVVLLKRIVKNAGGQGAKFGMP